jgi:RNA polymerase sigma-B factor
VTQAASATRAGQWGAEQRRRERDLLAELADLGDEDPRRPLVRDELVTMHLPLVRHLARRYRDRGESLEDLVQVGTVGLIKAVDRFDLAQGTEFSTYATPTILGEIKRHFRDRTWAMHVPRRVQELQAQVTARSDELTGTLGRSPTVRELAESLGCGEDDILDAIEARHAYAVGALDAGDVTHEGGPPAVADRLGVEDPAFETIDDRETLRPLLARLPERERRIIMLRFFRGMSQTQIAEELGISQMHVSRLLARSLAQLRAGLAEPPVP